MVEVIASNVILWARRKAGNTTTAQVSDANAYIYSDEVYQELLSEIKDLWQYYNKKDSYINCVAYQNQYALPTDYERWLQLTMKYKAPTDTAWVTWTVYTAWTKVTDSWKQYVAKIDHTAWWTFAWDSTKWTQIRENYLPVTWVKSDFFDIWLLNNTLCDTDPRFVFNETTIDIYPRPKEAVVEWIHFTYVYKIDTIVAWVLDSSIKLQPKHYKVWEYWIVPKLFHEREMYEQEDRAEAKYQFEKKKMMDQLVERDMNNALEEFPNFRYCAR